jgi:uncharacterized protein involved in exopolysaccharide biosynthesis
VHLDNNIRYISDERLDLLGITKALWKKKWILFFVTLSFSGAGIIYSLSLPNIYMSEVLLAPSMEQGAMTQGQLGGLAALAGVNLGNSKSVDKTLLAIEIIKSRAFLGRFIERYDLLPKIMAVESWNMIDNSFVYNEDVYDETTDSWVREARFPKGEKPTLQEAHNVLLKHITISQDVSTGMVKLSVKHQSPYIAQSWATFIVRDINSEMKERDIREAVRSIEYLKTQVDKTNIADIKSTLFSLIEEQTKTLMLAHARDEYVFKTIDPAIVAEDKVSPKRALLCVFFTLFGFIVSIVFVFLSITLKQTSDRGRNSYE